MAPIRGHFDGKVIIPDEPLNLPPNQELLVHLEPLTEQTTDFRSWLGLANRAPENPNRRFHSERDLWE